MLRKNDVLRLFLVNYNDCICILFYINYLYVKRHKSEDMDSVSDKNVEDLTLLTLLKDLCFYYIPYFSQLLTVYRVKSILLNGDT